MNELQLCETHFERQNYDQLLLVCSLAYAVPKLMQAALSRTFESLLYMAACYARHSDIAFEFLRCKAQTITRAPAKLWNGLGTIIKLY